MLTELHIVNFAIIEDQTISFGPGLNVLTGETGSGKSVVLGAMECLLGGRVSSGSIRSGSDFFEVQGLFDLSKLSASQLERLPEIAQEPELSISRALHSSGKSKIFINGKLCTVKLLEETASILISLCGQNQHVELLHSKFHRELLDDYAGIAPKFHQFSTDLAQVKALEQRIQEFEADRQTALRRNSELSELVTELTPLAPRAGLRSELEQEIRSLAGAEQLREILSKIIAASSDEHSLDLSFKSLHSMALEAARVDPSYGELADEIKALRGSFDSWVSTLTLRLRAIEVNEEGLEAVKARLSQLAKAERKYRLSDAELAELLSTANQQLTNCSDSSGEPRLRAELAKAQASVKKLAQEIDTVRRSAAIKLEQGVSEELSEVALGGAKFSVRIGECNPFSPTINEVEFLIATNKGEPQKPLRAVASGGELARITLILKNLLTKQSQVNVLVFDEVDVGISGSVARAVGEKLKRLASHTQVICVTHLAQVASLADHHLLVQKEGHLVGQKEGEDRIAAKICHLTKSQRVDEIARMLAGYKITPAARRSAQELLQYSDRA